MEPKKPALIHRVRRWPRKLLMTVGIIVVVLIAARIALPQVVKSKVNERLRGIPGYTGHVGEIDIALWRGAYTLHDLEVYRVSGDVREPFVLARMIDFAVAWRELFRGKIVSDIRVDKGELTFVAGETEEESQKDVDRRWQDVIEDLFPLEITHFELRNGTLRYQDMTTEPHLDVFVENMRVVATGLRNRPEEAGAEFPAEVTIDGETLGGGQLSIDVRADPLAAQPHFHLSAKVDGVNLPDLNEFLRAFANVDVSQGTFQLAAEMAGKEGGFQGYLKPFFEDVDFTDIEERDKGVLTRIWEKAVQGLAWLVKNKERDQLATRIPFQGRFGDPEVGLFTTIANLFRHGFVRAFNPTVEGSIDPGNILPSGKSADGKDVADTKTDPVDPPSQDPRAGEPTGRRSPRAVDR